MGRYSDLKRHHTTAGPRLFWIAAITVVTLIANLGGLEIWLSAKTGWPDAFGFRCHGRSCMIEKLYHSPSLLRRGGSYDIALFAVLWALPALMLIVGVVTSIRGRGAAGR